MKGKAALSALLLMGAAVFAAAPARAEVAIGFSFGTDGGYFSDPCDYYDYYSEAPPWGLPPDYCDYPVYFEPVYWGGYWYRGPIYYRWYGGQRLFWLNGGWRHDEWRGARPSIRWTDRGGWRRGDNHFYGGNSWSGRGDWNRGRGDWNRGRDRGDWNRGDRGSWSGGNHNWSGNTGSWSGGNHNSAGGSNNWSGGNRNWSGGGGGGGGHNWSGGGGGGGGHNWSGGGGGGGHNWSGGGGHSWSGGGRGGDGRGGHH